VSLKEKIKNEKTIFSKNFLVNSMPKVVASKIRIESLSKR
jgi:hypothetical protein